jgi:hypothetical protein
MKKTSHSLEGQKEESEKKKRKISFFESFSLKMNGFDKWAI